MTPKVHAFFDEATNTITYVVQEPEGRACAVIDSVLDFDQPSGRTSHASADAVIAYVRAEGLSVDWLLETHAHADHLSAAPFFKQQLGAKIGIGEHIKQVQQIFKDVFNLEKEFLPNGAQFDHMFKDGDELDVGGLSIKVMHTPGHTPADLAYIINQKAAFVGDTLFMPDVGTARCDFPGGNAHQLYASVRKLLSLPDHTRLFMCHDYPPTDRAPVWETTVAAQRQGNIHVHDGISEEAFVTMRQTRDATLDMPVLILPAVQVNIRAGELPPAEANGTRYLKIPVNAL
mgnify:CR=1 FL=1